MKKIVLFFICVAFLLGCQRKIPPPVTATPSVGEKAPEFSATDYFEGKRKLSQRALAEGQALLKKGKQDLAIAKFREAITTFPIDAPPYLMLADTYFNRGEYDLVIKVLEEAGGETPFYPFLYQSFFRQKWAFPKTNDSPHKVFIAQFKDNKQCAISFMLCDGSVTEYTHGLPLLEHFGYRATIGVVSNLASEAGKKEKIWGSWDQWQDASRRGFEICNHTLHHKILDKLTPQVRDEEINRGYDLIKEKIGQPPFTFIFPGTRWDEDSVKAAQARHEAIVDHDDLSGIYERVFVPYYGGDAFNAHPEIAETLLDFAIQNHFWVIPLWHGVRKDETYYIHRPLTVDFVTAHLEQIKAKDDKIWVDTVKNIYQYLRERKNADLRILKSDTYSVTFILRHNLPPDIYSMPLTVVIDTSPVHPSQATANVNNAELAAKIEGTKLYLNVVPGENPISVRWR